LIDAMDRKLSFVGHLDELRSRILRSVIIIAFFSSVAYFFSEDIITQLSSHLDRLVFIAPQEALVTRIKVSLLAGLATSLPFVFFQLWRFISDAMTPPERRYALVFAPLSLLLFLLGAAFGYLLMLPVAMRFLLGFQSSFLVPMISAERYISFVAVLTFSFGLIFQLPAASIFLARLGLIDCATLRRKRRHAIVMIFIAAAIITPPDVVTQCMLSVPLMLLYELSIVLVKIFGR